MHTEIIYRGQSEPDDSFRFSIFLTKVPAAAALPRLIEAIEKPPHPVTSFVVSANKMEVLIMLPSIMSNVQIEETLRAVAKRLMEISYVDVVPSFIVLPPRE